MPLRPAPHRVKRWAFIAMKTPLPTSSEAASASTSTVAPVAVALVDAHVHLHACFDLEQALEQAARNFRRAMMGLGVSAADAVGCLMLTETARDDRFRAMSQATPATIGRWRVEPTQEPCSLTARAAGELLIAIVAGRQVVTREDLEVLALGTTQRFDDGEPIESTLQRVREAGALAVVPWGFGKWTGRRGRIVRGLIEQAPPQGLCLGDNGGRWRWGPYPRLLRQAQDRGLTVLPGSDPLPFPRQIHRLGGYGFVLPGALDPRTPAASVRRALGHAARPLRCFGSRQGTFGFVYWQIAMQLRKRMERFSR